MLTYEEARRVAAEYIAAHLGPKFALMENVAIERPYGWLFGAQSRAYLETGDESEYLFGFGGLFVERDCGRVLTFGSRYSWDTWLTHYEKGFRYDFYDLIILSVWDRRETVRLLARLEMSEHVREWEHGVEWLASRPYTARRIRAMLNDLPCTFRRQSFADRVEVFDALNAAGCCTYRLEEHREAPGGSGQRVPQSYPQYPQAPVDTVDNSRPHAHRSGALSTSPAPRRERVEKKERGYGSGLCCCIEGSWFLAPRRPVASSGGRVGCG